MNISRYNDASIRPAEPPRPPLAPNHPPSPPPRPPRRRGPQGAAPATDKPADPAAQGGDGEQPSGSGDQGGGQAPSLDAASPTPPPLGAGDGGGAPVNGDTLQRGGEGFRLAACMPAGAGRRGAAPGGTSGRPVMVLIVSLFPGMV